MLYMFYNPIKHQIRVIISRLIKTSFHVLRLVQGHTKKEITSICSSNVKSVLADMPLSTNKLFHKCLIPLIPLHLAKQLNNLNWILNSIQTREKTFNFCAFFKLQFITFTYNHVSL